MCCNKADAVETVHHLMLGTTNAAKIGGVQAACEDLRDQIRLPDLSQPATWTMQVDSGVDDHPLGFAMTVTGAQNRAQAAYDHFIRATELPHPDHVTMGIGVESGFIDVDASLFTLYNFDVCALFDGTHYFLGISPGFEYPRRLVHNIFHHRQPFQEARQYISAAPDVERQKGIVGVIAGGLVDRPEMTRLCTRLAWIRYLRRQAYEAWQ
jgi:inosine/xanthosine triphosphatase